MQTQQIFGLKYIKLGYGHIQSWGIFYVENYVLYVHYFSTDSL